MKLTEAAEILKPLYEKCRTDGDTLFICYFSACEDSYAGLIENLDEGDALIIISQLIEKFKLMPEAVIASCQARKCYEQKKRKPYNEATED